MQSFALKHRSVLVLMLPLLVWLTPDLRIKKSLLKCNWTIRKRLFFFNNTATTEIYTLSLHDALPIFLDLGGRAFDRAGEHHRGAGAARPGDRKSTRLNSSHLEISYAVFCFKT